MGSHVGCNTGALGELPVADEAVERLLSAKLNTEFSRFLHCILGEARNAAIVTNSV